MILHEEFDRCDECNSGWFRIEKLVLIQKNSPGINPIHHKEKEVYVCNQCGNKQYEKSN